MIHSNLHRPEDFLARYGGEEFTLVLPNTDGRGAFHLAEVIRTALLSNKIAHATSPICPYVTLSLGVTCFTPDQCTEKGSPESAASTLIEIADQALYEAKQKGRNRTVFKVADSIKAEEGQEEKIGHQA